ARRHGYMSTGLNWRPRAFQNGFRGWTLMTVSLWMTGLIALAGGFRQGNLRDRGDGDARGGDGRTQAASSGFAPDEKRLCALLLATLESREAGGLHAPDAG